MLLSTHILPEVTLICQRVAIINHGRLLAIDSPSGLQQASEQTNNVSLEVSGPADAVKQELLAIEGVNAVHRASAAGPRTTCSRRMPGGAARRHRGRIARAVAARWELHRLERQQPTLENIFLRYVDRCERAGVSRMNVATRIVRGRA